MAEDNDGMGEALDGQLRTALAVAMQLAQRFARLREELARAAQARTEQQTRELQARFDTERSAAVASLAPVHRAEWWDHAGVEDIAAAFETAEAWRPVDTGIAGTADHMRDEIRARYGVDVDELSADPARVRDLLERTERDRADAAAQRGESRVDAAESAVLLTTAELLERDVEQPDQEFREAQVEQSAQGLTRAEILAEAAANRDHSALAYDSAERRQQAAAEMEKSGLDPELVRMRTVTDRDNAVPATAAVATKPGKQSRARTATKTPSLQRERGGRSR